METLDRLLTTVETNNPVDKSFHSSGPTTVDISKKVFAAPKESSALRNTLLTDLHAPHTVNTQADDDDLYVDENHTLLNPSVRPDLSGYSSSYASSSNASLSDDASFQLTEDEYARMGYYDQQSENVNADHGEGEFAGWHQQHSNYRSWEGGDNMMEQDGEEVWGGQTYENERGGVAGGNNV